jgi:hypothetical protein
MTFQYTILKSLANFKYVIIPAEACFKHAVNLLICVYISPESVALVQTYKIVLMISA